MLRLAATSLALTGFVTASACGRGAKDKPGEHAKPRRLVVLHTSDLHDHIEADGDAGGFARLAAAVADRRKAAGDAPVLLVDAGDFSMGTPFTLLGPRAAPQLVLMGAMGYDAIAIGNHDLDWGPDGLASMLARAREQGFDVPIVCSNMRFDEAEPGDDAVAELHGEGAIRAKLVANLPGGLRVGIFGLLGPDAFDVSPDAAPLVFDRSMKEHTASAQKIVDELRENDRVDVVIALAHEGCGPDGAGEACELGRTVEGIDLIVGGHTHLALEKPVTAGSTTVVQAGSYAEWLGEAVLELDAEGAVTAVGHSLLHLDEGVREERGVAERIATYRKALDEHLASYSLGSKGKRRPLRHEEVVAETAFEVGHEAFREDAIGDLVTDAYRMIAGELDPKTPPAVALEATGLIRDALRPGADGGLRFDELFRVLPLGRGFDGEVGYPLVTYHLTPRDLRAGLEIAALAANMRMAKLAKYFLQTSGLRARYRSDAPMFQSVQSIALDRGGALDLADQKTCVRVVSSLRVGELLGTVEKLSRGTLQMTPLEADCKTPVSDWQAHVVDADPETEGVQELKAWHALMRYLATREDRDRDGIPDLPAVYREAQDRFGVMSASTP